MVVYEVPILPPDQPRAQSVTNCVDAFINLQGAIDHIFSTITERIENTTKRVDDLKRRAALAQAKVDHLRGTDKATQVFCSAVYPGDAEPRYHSPLFSGNEVAACRTGAAPASRHAAPPAVQDHGEFFHVRSSGAKVDMFGRPILPAAAARTCHVSPLPPHIHSVSSLLLFATNSNLYKDEKRSVAGKRSKPRAGGQAAEEASRLEAAPSTLTEGDLADLISQDEFQYLPDLSDLPELDMPTDLPALTGLANDLLFDGSADTGIAPSVSMLPATILPSNTNAPPAPVSSASSRSSRDTSDPRGSAGRTNADVGAVVPSAPPAPTAAPPPPPPPPPPPQPAQDDAVDTAAVPQSLPAAVLSEPRGELMKAIQQAGGSGKAKLRPVQTKTSGSASRTPHTELMHAIEETGSAALRHVEPQPRPPEEPSNPHSQLMHAIQQAGGSQKANLKKVEPAKKEEGGRTAASAGGGDLMADLFARLSQRRKGISGGSKTEGGEGEAVNPMQKIASIIPPPPPPPPAPLDESGSGAEDDGDDDWN